MRTVLIAPPEAPLFVAADEEEPEDPPPPPLEDPPIVALPEVEDPPPEDSSEPAPPPQLASTRASTRARAATASVPFSALFTILGLLGGEVRSAWRGQHGVLYGARRPVVSRWSSARLARAISPNCPEEVLSEVGAVL